MKQASKFMPKYVPKKVSKLAQLAFFTISVVFILAIFTAVVYHPIPTLAMAGLIAIVTGYSVKTEHAKIEKHFQQLYKEREGLSICEFAREFDAKVIDTWIIRAVYEELQDMLLTEQKIPIKASDNLFDTLMLDEEDIDLDLVEVIAQRTGRSLENNEINPYYGKVTTARNLVLFFNHQHRMSTA